MAEDGVLLEDGRKAQVMERGYIYFEFPSRIMYR